MEHRIRSKLNTQIYEEACEWFIECRAGELADTARYEFDRWLKKSPEHLSAYLEIAAIWDAGPSLDPVGKYDHARLIAESTQDQGKVVALPPLGPVEDERHTSAGATDGGRATMSPAGSRTGPVQRWRSLAVAAAISAAAVGTGALIWSQIPPGTSYSTAIGEQRSIEFADGSTVELNSLSRVRVHYTKGERDVLLLEGQALFTVAKDPGRPFVVRSGATRVRAVGTEFDVYKKRDDTVVTVVEGRVAVLARASTALRPAAQAEAPTQRESPSNSVPATVPLTLPFPQAEKGGKNVFVSAGEQLTVTPKTIELAQHADVARATAWTQRELIFRSASLTEVAQEFNRYNFRQLIISDPSLETFHVSGVFSSTDPSSLIRFLRERPELSIVETSSEIRIKKK